MALDADPWRTLGLNPGASLDEIRRAYRRLAKVNHPDAAGEGALPRFLAIQAAYEQLAGPERGRRVGARPGSTRNAGRPSPDEREPWRADPDRARASSRADGRRTPGARPGGGSGAPPRRGSGGQGQASDRTSTGTGPTGGTRRPSGGRRRPAKSAGPGSTSYEGADQEPFEPGWTGATWYGASSGTYWTINPKEYADPRKHGPEYQARARRARGEAPSPDEPASESVEPEAATEPSNDQPEPIASAWTSRRPPGGRRHRPDAAAAQDPDLEDAPRPRFDPGDGPRVHASRSWADAEPRAPTAGGFHGPVLRLPGTPTGRLLIALLGWPPLGLFAATAAEETSGCGRYAAGCPEVFAPGTWILQVAIVLLLLAVPRVAYWSAHGAIAMLVAGVPAAVALSAAGGTNVRDASAPILIAVLAFAYLAGVVYAVVAGRRATTG